MHWFQVEPQGQKRLPCEDHSATVVDKCIYILFGKSELDNVKTCPAVQVLDTETLRLSPLSAEGENGGRAAPEERQGHSASIVRGEIYIFGGTWTDDENVTLYMNDLHVLNTARGVWRRPITTGTVPIEREGHSASVVGNLIYFFAGTWVDYEDNSIYLDDLHVLETTKMSWTQPSTSGKSPSPREGHSASVVGKTIVIFAGAGPGELSSRDEAVRMPIKASVYFATYANTHQTRTKHHTHARLVQNNTSINLRDLHLLDTAYMQWTQPVVSVRHRRLCVGAPPSERRYHTATAIDRRVFVFGGQYFDADADLHFECENAICELDLDSLAWTQHADLSRAPMRRACHAAAAVGKFIYVLGGRYWDASDERYVFLNDVHILDTRPPSTLAVDWRRYLNNEELSDLKLLVEEKEIPVHRVVLAARCGYFRRMFESGMREASEKQVKITDISYPVLMALLDHLYSDTIEEGFKKRNSKWREVKMRFPAGIELPLFAAADRFGLERLKQECATAVESRLCVENVCNVLTVAEQHNAADLIESSVAFIVAQFSEIHGTDGFQALPRSLLALVHAAISAALFPPPTAASPTAASPTEADSPASSAATQRHTLRRQTPQPLQRRALRQTFAQEAEDEANDSDEEFD